MKTTYLAFLLAILMSFTVSCSVTRMNSTTTASPDMGSIRITGNVDSIHVLINEVEQSLTYQDNKALVQLPAGNYKIEIFRDKVSILNQKLIVSMSVTTEVFVP